MRPLNLFARRRAAAVMPPRPTPAVEEPPLTVAQRAARARKAKLLVEQAAGSAAAPRARASRPRRDPAPSRIAYKLHRLWLTPMFRTGLLRIALPLLLGFALAHGYLGDPARRGAIYASITDLRQSVKSRPEFMVRLVSIEGASPEVAELIRSRFPLELPVSSFDLDLEVLQAEIAELDALESAALRIRPGGVLEIAVLQRRPAAIWREGGSLVLLDRAGNRTGTLASRAQRPDLPLLAGAGAQDRVDEALALTRAARPIAARLRGLVRIGQRRWDLVLEGGVTIRLPEQDPVPALAQVIALDEAQDLLARAILSVDMRNPLRPTIRLAPGARAEMRRIKAIEMGEKS